MNQPRLYQKYDDKNALGLFGSQTEAQKLCDGQWVILPHVVLGFAEVGEPPGFSHFTSGSGFRWVAGKPYRVSDDRNIPFVPREVVPSQYDRPIRLFVRPQGSERYWYVGELRPAGRFTMSGRDNHGEADFDLSPALPSQVWSEIGGYRVECLDHAAVDGALDRLRQPMDVEGRLGVLREVVTYWHGLIRPEDGIPEAELEGLAIPYPLRWWYRWAGRRRKIISGQNILLQPNELRVRDDLLVFYGENQWCYEWATLFEGDDPPVFGRAETTEPWEPEGITLSEHLILACLFEGIMCHSPYGASASWLNENILNGIIEHIPPISLGPWHWLGPARFYARGGAFMYTMPNGEMDGRQGYSVWLGAKTEHPLQFLKPYLDDTWEYVAV